MKGRIQKIKGDNCKGFTLVELLIVLALIGIIGATMIPMYSDMTEKSALKMDIRTAENLQNILEIYQIEHAGKLPPEEAGGNVYEELVEKGYISERDIVRGKEIDDETKIRVQTRDAEIIYQEVKNTEGNKVVGARVEVLVPSEIYKAVKEYLDDYERSWIEEINEEGSSN